MTDTVNVPREYLRAIVDGYAFECIDERFIVIENPRFEEDNGELPRLVIDALAATPASDELLEAAERALRYIDACAEAGEFTPNDDAENPAEVWEALNNAIAKHKARK